MADVKMSTTLPELWAEELERLSHVPIGLNRPPTKAAMLRSGVRLYLQQRSAERWDELDLGPAASEARPPDPVIDSTAEEIIDLPELDAG